MCHWKTVSNLLYTAPLLNVGLNWNATVNTFITVVNCGANTLLRASLNLGNGKMFAGGRSFGIHNSVSLPSQEALTRRL